MLTYIMAAIFSQCIGPFCTPRSPTFPGIPGASTRHQAVPDWIVVIEALQGGVVAKGTGVAISGLPGEKAAFLTAGHVVRGAREIFVTTKDGRFKARLYANAYPGMDVACLEGPPVGSLITIAAEDPSIGVEAAFGGFGSGRYREIGSRVAGYTADGNLWLEGAAMPGDSGGPAWTSNGLIGIVVATDGRRTLAISLRNLARFFEGRYVFPWNAWLDAQKDAGCGGSRQSPQAPAAPRPEGAPIPQAPAPPPLAPGGHDWKPAIDALDAKIEAIRQDYQQFKASIEKRQVELEESLNKLSKELHDKSAKAIALWILLGLVLLVAVVIGAIDIYYRRKTGDPLEIEKLLRLIARLTPGKADDILAAMLSAALDRIIGRKPNETRGSNTRSSDNAAAA